MPEPLVDRVLARQGWMDRVGDVLQAAIGAVFGALGRPGKALKNLLHGTTLAHQPLHPALTDVPVGAWLAGAVADIAAHYTARVPTEAGDIALAVGLVTALATAATGYTDFHATFGLERRTALAHGLAMTLVVALDTTSLALRWFAGAGAHAAAVIFSLAGFALLVGGAHLGGHLVFRFGTMVNRNAFAEPLAETVRVGHPDDFPEGALRRVDAAGTPVLVVRTRGTLKAIGAVCSHAGGPLDEGSLDGDRVTCPWHGSVFCLKDGRPTNGPATFSQPAYSIEEEDGADVRVGPPS